MAGYPVNGSEIIKKVFRLLAQEGPMAVKKISYEIVEEEEDVDRALHQNEGECVKRVHTDKERWEAIPGEDDDDYL
jgi:hypothetical protein